ncbi:serine/threonine protein kinase, partial [Pyxidicoccus sp. 3LFB2]
LRAWLRAHAPGYGRHEAAEELAQAAVAATNRRNQAELLEGGLHPEELTADEAALAREPAAQVEAPERTNWQEPPVQAETPEREPREAPSGTDTEQGTALDGKLPKPEESGPESEDSEP